MSQFLTVADAGAVVPSKPFSPTKASTSSGGAGGHEEEFEAGPLIMHLDILILVMIGAIILLQLPRGLARFWARTEWMNGHFFWHEPRPKSTALRDITFYDKDLSLGKAQYTTYGKGSQSSLHRQGTYLTAKEKGQISSFPIRSSFVDSKPPPHVATCFGLLRSVETPLRARFVEGFSVGQVAAILLYLACLVYPSFYMSNPFSDSKRAGWIAISQAPFVIAFAMKNNVLGVLLGYGYEKLNFLHRFIGRIVVLAANVHAIGYFYSWVRAGTFSERIASRNNMWGFIGLICLDVLVFFSIDFWRKKAYNIFLATHITAYMLLLPALWLHKPSTRPYVITLIVLYGLDRLMRLLKTRYCTARLEPVPELDATRLSIAHLNAGWRAGQHVRIKVLSTGMGVLGCMETHPFTIASAPGGDDGLVLVCKKTGTWTRRLKELAGTDGTFNEKQFGRDVKVLVEGPYGGPGHAIFSSYSAVLLIAGGSGITFSLSTIQDLIRKDLVGESRVKVIELVWVMQDPAALVPLLPTFAKFIEQSIYTPVRITTYYTRAPVRNSPVSADLFPPGLDMLPGRPNISKIVDSTISHVINMGQGRRDDEFKKGLLVGVCGPTQLGDSVVRSVGQVEPPRRDQIGGVELHEEVFGW